MNKKFVDFLDKLEALAENNIKPEGGTSTNCCCMSNLSTVRLVKAAYLGRYAKYDTEIAEGESNDR